MTEFTASRSTIRNTKENSVGRWEIISDRKSDLQEESRIHKMVGIGVNKKENFFLFKAKIVTSLCGIYNKII